MPGARSRIKPLSASGSSGSSLDDVSQLELHLQRQLEEDIARIFDESIYSDLEVVCGKLKILTHSCILKARTHKFYHKLEAILHVNIGRIAFDEIYSFISDAYTECDIQHQEKEIIRYLNEKLNESEAYATPACDSPEDSLQKTLSSSPSTELTKEYYALVPIDGQILDKELIEQDELSSAFKSFIHLQAEQLNDNNNTHYTKPTTLSLSSSHFSKLNKHSISCDISKDLNITDSTSFLFENDKSKINNATSQVRKHIKSSQLALKKSFSGETASEVGVSGYSPDSLILDEPSSSSDYLSAGHSASPPGPPDIPAKMNNTTVSDSGIDNNGVLESQNGYMDVTLTDVSSTESTFHDLLNAETLVDSESATDLIVRPKLSNMQTGTSAHKLPIVEMSGRSSKDEKQRQNEEIIIMESSSLSSETGSWESVFPPKLPKRDLCEKFIKIERQNSIEPTLKSGATETARIEAYQCIDVAQKSSNKSACCFIDAASLADEEEKQELVNPFTVNISTMYRSSSQPVPCGSKQSPNDVSENNDIDDSLEQADLDSIQKDISPTIFEMTLAPDDYVAVNENVKVPEQQDLEMQAASVAVQSNDVKNCAKSLARTVFMTSTPNNSIISLKESNILTNNEYPETPRSPHTIRQDIIYRHFKKEVNDTISPIKPIEDNLPHGITLTENSLVSGSGLFTKRKIKSTPTPCSHILPQKINSETTSQASCASAWVVDMSKIAELDTAAANRNNKKPGDKTCDSLKAFSKSGSNSEGCKSRSSVDSDSSEKSTQRFYIDLSTLPDASAPEIKSTNEANNEKKNIFSMFIDLGENSNTVKEMPARLSLNTKKSSKIETKSTNTKNVKARQTFPGIMNADDNFEKLELLCNSPQLSISAILRNDIAIKVDKEKNPVEKPEIQDFHRTHPREGIAPTIREESDDQLGDIFVRLSDLDKAPVQNDESAPKTDIFERMSRSIPDNQWGESSHTSNRSIDIISSFHSENALSLNRLFPHLKTSNVISRSMPGALSGRTLTPLRLCGSSILGNRDEVASDISELSSLQSSMCRSVVENSTTEETSHTASLLANCQSRLGQDLLRMFVEEIAPDVVVEVSGRRIKAHKCILSSRCQYFAGILSGGWVASTGNVISLPPFSYSVAHFALCHIYSGVSVIPDTISIVELATIADMLGLEGLKEAIMFTLKAKYCHHFHEPCKVCTAGVLECFPLTSAYGLDELYQRCLRWITRYFRTVWPTKAYATLPADLLEKCYQEHLLNLTTHNLIDIVHDCGLTEASLKQCRWSEVVAQQCRRLAVATARFAASRFASVVRAYTAARAPVAPAAAHALDLCLASAAQSASPNDLCRALALLHATLATLAPHSPHAPPDPAAESLAALQRRCEKALYRAAPRALDVPAFYELPSDLRLRLLRYIKAAPAVRAGPVAPSTVPRPHRTQVPTDASVMDRDRTAFALYAQRSVRVRLPPSGPAPPALRPLTLTRSRPLAGSSAPPPRVRTTKAQEERAKYNMTKSVSAKPRVKSCGMTSGATAPCGKAKPHYLKTSTAEQAAGLAQRKPRAAHISPSDTSRTQSPAGAPAPRTADPSTESLSDSLNGNKYATYTKVTRNSARKPPPIQQPSKCKTNTDNQSNKTRATKIPIYSKLVMPRKRIQPSAASTSESAGASGSSGVSGATSGGARPRGSLMMATKSSSAKMVPKILKGSKTVKQDSGGASRPAGRRESHSPSNSDIPIMERSGTFLKDEPTFGDKTTNFDIDE